MIAALLLKIKMKLSVRNFLFKLVLVNSSKSDSTQSLREKLFEKRKMLEAVLEGNLRSLDILPVGLI